MKKMIHWAAAILLLSNLHSPLTSTFAQGTAFTYQGQLQDSGNPASGSYDLTFTLYTTNSSGVVIAGPLTNSATAVTNGLFTTLVDFGPSVFTGTSNWLAIAVRTNATGGFTTLSPYQQLTPAPYAVFAGTASNVSGTVSARQVSGMIPLAQLPGALVTNYESGVILSNVTVSGILSLPAAAVIDAGGGSLLRSDSENNFYAGPGAGTPTNSGSANTALGSAALQANTNGAYNTAIGERALNLNTSGNDNTATGGHALEANTVGRDNTANGYEALSANTTGSNNVALGVDAGLNITTGSFNIDIGNEALASDTNIIRIGSGQTSTFIAGVIKGNGGGLTNLNAAQLSGVIASGVAVPATNLTGVIPLARLPGEVVTNDAPSVTLGGTFSGDGGSLTNLNASQLTIGVVPSSVLPGFQLSSNYCAVGGGYLNQAIESSYATVPGGFDNVAAGEYSFAAGQQAQALHEGAFVWADSQAAV